MENKTPSEEMVIETKLETVPEAEEIKMKPPIRAGSVVVAILVLLVIVLGIAVFALSKRVNETSSTQDTDISESQSDKKIDTSNWKTYSDPKIGFSFKYPDTVLINDESGNTDKLILYVSSEKLSDIPDVLPLRMGRLDLLEERDRLTKGEGEGLIKIGGLYGQTSTILSQFEVCSVIFSKNMTFYPGAYHVRLSLSGPKNEIMADMPDFFTTDPENCGTSKTWNFDRMSVFESTLADNKGAGMGQTWYNTFYDILDTLEQATPVLTAGDETLYSNEKYGFTLTHSNQFKVLTDKDNLYGYPNGVALIYKGGQAYDIVIEAWDSQLAYEQAHSGNLANVTAFESKGKFITFYNNTESPDNKKIIDSVKISP
jgi:hypothetical protein